MLTDCTLNTDLALFIRHLIVPTTLSAADDHEDSSDDVSDTTRTKRGVVREREGGSVCMEEGEGIGGGSGVGGGGGGGSEGPRSL